VRAGSSAEAQTRRNEHRSRSRSWPLSRSRGKAIVSWGAGSRCSGFWAGRLRRKGSRDELACPTRGQTNIGGQRMTGPQRRPASLRAFPKLGPVMRWPGNSPVSAVFTQCSAAESEGGLGHRAWGQCRRVCVLRRRGGGARGHVADRSVVEWNAVKSRRVRRPGGSTRVASSALACDDLADGVCSDRRA
jgi:hypothetical protein